MTVSLNDDLLPHSIEAEQSVIGSMLIDRDTIASLADWLKPEAFYDTRNRRIYQSILWLWKKQVPTDHVTLSTELERVKRLDDIGGREYLAFLHTVVFTPVHALYYADIVRRLAHRRSLIEAGQEIVKNAYADDMAVEDATGTIRRLTEPFIAIEDASPVVFADTMPTHKQYLQDLWAGLINDRVTPTGIKPLDKAMLGGLRNEDMMTLAAPSGAGKTALMVQMAQFAAEKTNHLSVVVSLEMSEKDIKDRMGCIMAGVPFSTTKPRNAVEIYDLKKREDDEAALMSALDYLAELPIAILTKHRTTDRVLSELDRLAAHYELGMVLIDHLDHLEDPFRGDNEEQRFAELAKRCKGISQRVKIPTVVLSQVNRGSDMKPPFLPDPQFIRGSGRIRELSDVLVMPFRRLAYVEFQKLESDLALDFLPYPRGNEHRVDLFLFKNRNGENGLCMPMGFEPKSMAMTDASELEGLASIGQMKLSTADTRRRKSNT